ncbi:MAG: hypothetical protein KJ927_01325, partial [Candidatus Eisenbacteria bacterium]|nr:hypothetical protein [Candidatus Eisenbacteria bacterium]
MKKGNGEPVFMLKFAPDLWTSVDFCSEFIGLAVNLDREAVKGVWSSRSHLAKHDIIGELMTALRPALLEDTKQLESLGYTHAQWTKTYAALMETRFCELYACLDGIRRAIYGTYRNIEGVQNQSTQ